MSGICLFTAFGPENTMKNTQTDWTPTPLVIYSTPIKVCMKVFDPLHTNGIHIIPTRSIYPALFLTFRVI